MPLRLLAALLTVVATAGCAHDVELNPRQVAVSTGSAIWRVVRRRAVPTREMEPPDVVLQG